MAENIYENKVSFAFHLAMPGIPNDESVLNIHVKGKDPFQTKTRGLISAQ